MKKLKTSFCILFLCMMVNTLTVYAEDREVGIGGGITFKGSADIGPAPSPPQNTDKISNNGPSLPQTGQKSDMVLPSAGCGILLFAGWLVLVKNDEIVYKEVYINNIKILEEKNMKCSKKLVAFALAATMLFGNAIGASAANQGGTTTENKITFQSGGGSDVTPPADPEKPDITISPDPDKEKPTGNIGELRLDVVPVFDFGTQDITTTAKSYFAILPVDAVSREKVPYYVQVTDVRGTGAGWSLTAKMTSQFSDGTNLLAGAKIDLSNITSKAQTGSTAPSGLFEGTLEYDEVNDSTVKIATAAVNEGMGVTTIRFGDTARNGDTPTADESVKLTIPASTQVYANTYKATIKWTLGATP